MRFAIFILVLSASALEASSYKSEYNPYPGDGFPQIIQRDDYPTIEFIETVFTQLEKMAGRNKTGDFGQMVDCDITPAGLSFHRKGEVQKRVLLRKRDENTVRAGNEQFTDKTTVLYYSTLARILSDFTREFGKCRQVRFAQFGVKTYKKRTLIEFDFGKKVVQIDSYENGPQSDERLYILNIVDRKDSMFWSRDPVR